MEAVVNKDPSWNVNNWTEDLNCKSNCLRNSLTFPVSIQNNSDVDLSENCYLCDRIESEFEKKSQKSKIKSENADAEETCQPLASLDRYRQWHTYRPGHCIHREQWKLRSELYRQHFRFRPLRKERQTSTHQIKHSFEEKLFGVLPYPFEQIRQQYRPYRYNCPDWSRPDLAGNLPLVQMTIIETFWSASVAFLNLTPDSLCDDDRALLSRHFLMDASTLGAVTSIRTLPKRAWPQGEWPKLESGRHGDNIDACVEEVGGENEEVFVASLSDALGHVIELPFSETAAAMHYGHLEAVMKQCVRAVTKYWPDDVLVIALALGALYYNPDRPGLVDRWRVWRCQAHYYDLVKRYFASLYRLEKDVQLAFLLFLDVLGKVRLVSDGLRKSTSKLDYLHLSPVVERRLWECSRDFDRKGK